MRGRFLVAMSVALFSCAAFGDSSNPFIGTWKATWKAAGRTQQAAVVIKESGGTWRDFRKPSKRNQCLGREAPIFIESASASAMNIRLKFSESLRGCADQKVRLRRVEGNTVSGTIGRAALLLTRD